MKAFATQPQPDQREALCRSADGYVRATLCSRRGDEADRERHLSLSASSRQRLQALLSLITGYWLLITFTNAASSPDSALDAYRRGNYRSAEAQYSQLAKQKADDVRLRFNAGAAAYKNNDLTNAATWFESASGAPDLELQQQAYYNLGTTYFRLGEAAGKGGNMPLQLRSWQTATQHFGSAIRLNSGDSNAWSNFLFASNQVRELAKQMPKDQQPGESDDKGDSNDDEKKQQSSQLPKKGLKDSDKEETDNPESGDDQNKLRKGKNGDFASKQTNQPPQVQNTNKADQSQSSQPKDSQQQGDKQKQEGSDQAHAEQKDGQPAGSEAGQKSNGSGNESFAEQQGKPGEMTPVQAERLLDQQKGEEKALIFKSAAGGKEAGQRQRKKLKQW